MKITPEILDKQWSNIKYTDGGFLQIDTLHPLAWYIGYQSVHRMTLLLVCNAEIGAVESSKSMMVTRRRRESDNRYTLSFELLRDEQHGVFTTFCCDVIEHSRRAATETEALKQVISRYKQWSKLLETQNSGLMDENRRKGLIGELLFLEERISLSGSLMASMQGWTGADGADQDFIYPDCWFEIKSVGASSISVTISSLEQLDCADEGDLVVQRIDKVAPEKTGSFSLNDLVRRISAMLVDDAEASDLFRSKLSAYGYIDVQEYSKQKYYCSGTQRYLVNESFPKLTKTKVPAQISALRYELDLPSLTDWRKD